MQLTGKAMIRIVYDVVYKFNNQKCLNTVDNVYCVKASK